MPRQARIDYPGCVHHLISRGIERSTIFLDAEDHQTFIDYLGELIVDGRHVCYAWVLMSNHFHLLLERGGDSVSRLMKRLLTRYAGYFNRRHKRSGYLFQNRFKSIVCNRDGYLKKLVAYIHLNPLMAGIVKDMEGLERYRWSGHRILMGLEKYIWMDSERTLSFFGDRIEDVRGQYMNYLMDHDREHHGRLSGGCSVRSVVGLKNLLGQKKEECESFDSRVWGSGMFVDKVSAQEKMPEDHSIHLSVEELIGRISQELSVEPDIVYKKGKTTSR